MTVLLFWTTLPYQDGRTYVNANFVGSSDAPTSSPLRQKRIEVTVRQLLLMELRNRFLIKREPSPLTTYTNTNAS